MKARVPKGGGGDATTGGWLIDMNHMILTCFVFLEGLIHLCSALFFFFC